MLPCEGWRVRKCNKSYGLTYNVFSKLLFPHENVIKPKRRVHALKFFSNLMEMSRWQCLFKERFASTEASWLQAAGEDTAEARWVESFVCCTWTRKKNTASLSVKFPKDFWQLQVSTNACAVCFVARWAFVEWDVRLGHFFSDFSFGS